MFTLKHRLFSHQEYNKPESIQARNKEILTEEGKNRLENDETHKNKYKRVKRSSISSDKKSLHADAAMEIGEIDIQNKNNNLQILESLQPKFVPRPPKPREYAGSPLGKSHVRQSKLAPIPVKENFEGERNMLVIFDAIRRQPQGFFLYLAHVYPKNSVLYNFYSVR